MDNSFVEFIIVDKFVLFMCFIDSSNRKAHKEVHMKMTRDKVIFILSNQSNTASN